MHAAASPSANPVGDQEGKGVFLHRFRNARRWAALTLVPAAAATMITASLAVAQSDVLPESEEPIVAEPTTKERKMRSKVVIRVQRHVRTGRTGVVEGQVWPHAGNRRVTLRLDGDKVRTVRTGRGGRFRIRFRAPRPGVYRAAATAHRTGTAKRDSTRGKRINVYRATAASYYGPGLYGNLTACGQTLAPSTVGVANRSLPCGTKVTFRYRGRTVTARVIDRGPYAAGREWDLTSALKAKLGFGSTGTVLSTR
jgi:rare lipoprotein A (peptidoglycan hydrolase)